VTSYSILIRKANVKQTLKTNAMGLVQTIGTIWKVTLKKEAPFVIHLSYF